MLGLGWVCEQYMQVLVHPRTGTWQYLASLFVLLHPAVVEEVKDSAFLSPAVEKAKHMHYNCERNAEGWICSVPDSINFSPNRF